jgi:hypothetical protein
MITGDALLELLQAMNPEDLRRLDEQVRPARTAPELNCPSCGEPMKVGVLRGITIDRCHQHGIWFDGKELAAVLEAAGDTFAAGQTARGAFSIFGIAIGVGSSGDGIGFDMSPRAPKRPKDL